MEYVIRHGEVTVDCLVIWDEDSGKTTVIPVEPLRVMAGDSFTIEGSYVCSIIPLHPFTEGR
jgi:hypothetical protein